MTEQEARDIAEQTFSNTTNEYYSATSCRVIIEGNGEGAWVQIWHYIEEDK